MKVKSQTERTRESILSFLSKEELVRDFLDSLWKALDPEKTGTSTKADLVMFLGFFVEDCQLFHADEAYLEKIMKKVGLPEQLTSKHVETYFRALLNDQVNMLTA